MSAVQIEKNISLVKRLFDEILSKGNLSSYDHFVETNVEAHCPESWEVLHPSKIKGAAQTKSIDVAYFEAFKFENVTIEDIFASAKGDKIAVRWTCKGKHKGDFFGFKATNKTYSLSGTTIYRFNSEGKIIEAWQSWDMFGLLLQIEVIKMNQP